KNCELKAPREFKKIAGHWKRVPQTRSDRGDNIKFEYPNLERGCSLRTGLWRSRENRPPVVRRNWLMFRPALDRHLFCSTDCWVARSAGALTYPHFQSVTRPSATPCRVSARLKPRTTWIAACRH